MTRRRKCPRWADIIAGKVRYRRQPKGRRAKSGQWWKRKTTNDRSDKP